MNCFQRYCVPFVKLGVLLVVIGGVFVGCGDDDGEVVEEEEKSCDEMSEGTVETGQELSEELGIPSLNYRIPSGDPAVSFMTNDDSEELQGQLDLEAKDVGGLYDTKLVGAYSSDGQSDVIWRSNMGVVGGPGGPVMDDPYITMSNAIEIDGQRVAVSMTVRPNELQLTQVSEDNPMFDVESVMIAATDETGRTERLELASDGEVSTPEDEITQWLQEHASVESFDDERVEAMAAILQDEGVHETFGEISQRCQGAYRDGDVSHVRQQVGACEPIFDFGYGMSMGTLTKGLAAFGVLGTILGTGSDGVTVGEIFGKGEFTAEDKGSLIAILFIVVAGAFGGAGAAILMGVVVLAAGAFLMAGALLFNRTIGCGNPFRVGVDGDAFPFRIPGEFTWYTHRARDTLDIQIRQTPNPASSCEDGARIEALAAKAGDERVAFYADRDEPLWIDGESMDSSEHFWKLADGTQIERRAVTQGSEHTYVVTSPAGEVLRIDVFGDRLDIDLDLPEELRDEARGLIGSPEGDVDGLELRNGEVLKEPVKRSDLYRKFGASWQIDGANSHFDYRVGEGPEDFAAPGDVPAKRSLDDLTQDQLEYAERICVQNGQVTDPTLLHHCILDVGCTEDPSYMVTYSRLDAPKRELEIVDDDGQSMNTPVDDPRLAPDDVSTGAPAGFDGDFAGDDLDTVTQAAGSSCPADNENSAESVGSSQIRTIDGLNYQFRAAGEFVLVESRAADSLAVQVRQEPSGQSTCPNARRNTAVAAQLGEHRIGFYADEPGQVTIDGESSEVAGGFEVIGDGHTILRLASDHFYLEWPDRTWLDVRFGNYNRLEVRFNAHYTRMGQLQGVFGQFNGYPDNDIALRSGVELDDWDHDDIHGEFADSWRISDGESLFDYEEGESTDDFTDRDVPQSALSPSDIPADEEADARAVCEDAGVEHPQLVRDCIIDVYCTGEPNVAEEHADREGPSDDRLEWVDLVPGSGDLCCHVDCTGGPDDDCGFVCGTEEFEEPQDWCDGDCPTSDGDCDDPDTGDACVDGVVESAFGPLDEVEDLDYEDAAYICATRCAEFTEYRCIDDDGCCPAGGQCTSAMDNDCEIEPHVGSGCTEDDECATIGEGAPDAATVTCIDEELSGIFGGVCTAGCQDDDDCPADSHCADEDLHTGSLAFDGSLVEVPGNFCVPSCDSDADCARDGFGCYDANGDGRTECWHVGDGDGDFGDDCETSFDCGVGEWAVCAERDGVHWFDDASEDEFSKMCTRHCGPGAGDCPGEWVCDSELTVCVQPVEDDIGTACESHDDCESAPYHPAYGDRCFDEDGDYSAAMNGGYCTYGCEDDSDCPDGNRCSGGDDLFDDSGRRIYGQYCVRDCDDHSDCPRDGYGCYDTNFDGQTECWHMGTGDQDYGETCDTSADCGEVGEHAICRTDQQDDPDSGEPGFCSKYCGNVGVSCPDGWYCGEQQFGFIESCIPEIENEKIGQACTDEDECGEAPDEQLMNAQCLQQEAIDSKDGYCVIQGCGENDDCPAGSHCTEGNVPPGGIFGSVCLQSCDSNADCPRNGYECYDATGDGDTECWRSGTGTGGYGDTCEVVQDCSFGPDADCHFMGSEPVCTTLCADDRDSCPDGYGCSLNGNCILQCDVDDDCPGFSSCLEEWIINEDGSEESGCI